MHRLPLLDGAEAKIKKFSRDLYEPFVFARGASVIKRKTRSASLPNMKRQLRFIESGSNTLLKRLKNAPENVFQTWANVTDVEGNTNRQKAVYKWLQLKRLLQDAAERAKRAAGWRCRKRTPPRKR